MSTNAKHTNTSTICVQVPSGTAPGDPVVIGAVRGVAESVFDSSGKQVSNTTDGNGFAAIRIAVTSVFRLSVLASTDDNGSPLGGASAVALGDLLYKDDSTEVISKDSSGTKQLGIALGTPDSTYGFYATGTQVASGATANCDVLIAS